MFYTENLPFKKQQTIELKLSDFSKGLDTQKDDSVLPFSCAKRCFNFNNNKGSLTQGLGLSPLKTPFVVFGKEYAKDYTLPEEVGEIKNIWVYNISNFGEYRYDPLFLVYGDNQKLYSTNPKSNSGFSQVGTTMQLDGDPVGINYRIDESDYMIFASTNAQDYLYAMEGIHTLTRYVGCPSVLSLAKYANRLFATSAGEKQRLYFSNELDPRNWIFSNSQNMYVEIADERGALNKLFDWNNYLYIIRDFGITRISAWNSQEDFVVRNLYKSTSKIYANTCVLCGNEMLMLQNDGVYSFDGTDAKKLSFGFEKYLENVSNENAVAAAVDGKYYLACRLNFDDDFVVGCESTTYKNNALIEIDLKTQQYQIFRGVDIKLLLSFVQSNFSRLVCCLNTEGQKNKLFMLDFGGQVDQVPTKKVWQSPTTDLSFPSKQKILNEMYITTNNNLTVVLTTDQGTFRYLVSPSIIPQKLKLNKRCTTFCVAFETEEASVDVLPPTLVITLV